MANLAFLDSSAEAQINRRFCWKAVDFLRDAVAMADLDTDDDLAHRRLGIRLINNAGAFGRCALAGYYQPALAMIRDIVEIGFLLELFVHERSHLETWRTATVARRSRLYKPIQVREMLDKYSPAGKSDRDDAYKFLSMHGTHVSPSAVQVISPNAATMLGPFADRDR